MTKKQFVKRIRLVQNFMSEQETLSALIYKLTDNSPVITMGNCLISTIIDLINESLSIDDKDLLLWWLWEDVEKKIWWEDNGETIEAIVETPEQLYDYIISCHKEG